MPGKWNAIGRRWIIAGAALFVVGLSLGAALFAVPGSAQKDEEQLRPILFFDARANDFVIAAVYPNGEALGAVAEGPMFGWSPTGDWFAFYSRDDALTLRNLQGDERVLYKPSPGEHISFLGPQSIWSRDGQRIAVIVEYFSGITRTRRSPSLLVIDATSGTPLAQHELGLNFVFAGVPSLNALQWSPDSNSILLSWGRTTIIDVETGDQLEITDGVSVGEWTPSGNSVLYFARRSNGGEVDLHRAELTEDHTAIRADVPVLTGFPIPPLIGLPLISTSPDGRTLAMLGSSPRAPTSVIPLVSPGPGVQPSPVPAPPRTSVVVLVQETGAVLRFEHPAIITALSWSPDSSLLAAMTTRDNRLNIETLDPQTGVWRQIDRLEFQPRGTEIDVLGIVKTLSWAR
jgi:WD40 repeat protein